jgi:Malonate decarboxylase, alpha subunit, transporter
LDAVEVGKKAGMPITTIMIYGDDVSHVVTEEGIAYQNVAIPKRLPESKSNCDELLDERVLSSDPPSLLGPSNSKSKSIRRRRS